MKNLYLFTNTFPSTAQITEAAFLTNEVKFLSRSFDLTIVPAKYNKEMGNLNSQYKVDATLALKINSIKKNQIKFLSIFELLFWMEIFRRPLIIFNIKKMNSLINYLMTTRIVLRWLHKKGLYDDTILYTFWFTATSTAIAKYAMNKKNITAISRAHGIDLYEERTGYLPIQEITINMLTKLYTASKAGRIYLLRKFNNPDFEKKISVSYLGVSNPRFENPGSNDNVIRILSCSSMIEVKRINLIIKGLSYYCKNYSNNIFWVHIGAGPLQEECSLLAINEQLNFKFEGTLLNEEVLRYYLTHPVDYFINTSSSEGCPVSIQEAMSFGVPVIATNVGGIPELIRSESGILLSQNPSPKEIADAIKLLNDNNILRQNMRSESKKFWASNFDAEKNYNEFVNEISKL